MNKQHNKTNPEHYKLGQGIELYEVFKLCSTPEEYRGYLRLSSMKYLARLHNTPQKDSALDNARKAKWFVDMLVSELGDDESLKQVILKYSKLN